MGISTWISGRLFLKTATKPGTLTVQVAHTQEAAESLFRMVHRFVDCLPRGLRQGALRTSKASVRQIVFPRLDSEYRVESAGDTNAGRGLTITNLHCSEVARWPGDAAETLQGLRAAMPPDGELILESTPMGAGGCFWREWQEAPVTGMVQHFFPWWIEGAYSGPAVCETTLTEEESRLMMKYGLTFSQIGYRRQLFADYRGLAKQEYAENASECFLSSGECHFDTGAIDRRMAELDAPIAVRLGGQLQIWYPPVAGRSYLVAVDPAGGGADGRPFSCPGVGCGDGHAVRGIAVQGGRVRTCAGGGEAGEGVQRGAGCGGAEQSWGGDFGVSGRGVPVSPDF